MKYVSKCHGNPWVSGHGWEWTLMIYHHGLSMERCSDLGHLNCLKRGFWWQEAAPLDFTCGSRSIHETIFKYRPKCLKRPCRPSFLKMVTLTTQLLKILKVKQGIHINKLSECDCN
jgi:hypothetical protein